jgi:hypothetical protein
MRLIQVRAHRLALVLINMVGGVRACCATVDLASFYVSKVECAMFGRWTAQHAVCSAAEAAST